jgi:hypothetical protein
MKKKNSFAFQSCVPPKKPTLEKLSKSETPEKIQSTSVQTNHAPARFNKNLIHERQKKNRTLASFAPGHTKPSGHR